MKHVPVEELVESESADNKNSPSSLASPQEIDVVPRELPQKIVSAPKISKDSGIQKRRHFLAKLATLCAYVLSSWLTTKGLFDKAIEAKVSTTEGMLTAAMSGITAALVLGIAMLLAIGVTETVDRKQWWIPTALIVGLSPFIFTISTVYAIMANAGPPSLVYDMKDKAKLYADFYASQGEDSGPAVRVKRILEITTQKVCEDAELELNEGHLSGRSGHGAVHEAYRNGCDTLNRILVELEKSINLSGTESVDVKDILDELIEIPLNDSISVFSRQTEFRIKIKELNIRLREISSVNGSQALSQSLTGLLKLLETEITTLGVESGKFGENQKVIINELERNLTEIFDAFSESLNELGTDISGSIAIGDLLSMREAMFKYWKENLPQIMLAFMIDFMPLYFVALLVLTKQPRRELDFEKNS